MNRLFHILVRAFGFALLAGTLAALPSLAQNKVKTETIRDPDAPAKAAKQQPATAEVIRDLSRLPDTVRQRREEILAAARSGDIAKVAALVKANQTLISLEATTTPQHSGRSHFRTATDSKCLPR